MTDRDRIVAIGYLTASDLQRLGEGFTRAYPVEESDSFADLLRRLEEVPWEPGMSRVPSNGT